MVMSLIASSRECRGRSIGCTRISRKSTALFSISPQHPLYCHPPPPLYSHCNLCRSNTVMTRDRALAYRFKHTIANRFYVLSDATAAAPWFFRAFCSSHSSSSSIRHLPSPRLYLHSSTACHPPPPCFYTQTPTSPTTFSIFCAFHIGIL